MSRGSLDESAASKNTTGDKIKAAAVVPALVAQCAEFGIFTGVLMGKLYSELFTVLTVGANIVPAFHITAKKKFAM